jgi:hypothetical protein
MSEEAIRAYLLARVEPGPGGCDLWTGRVDRRGYGLAWINGRQERAARASYKAFVGPIPPGHDVHHLCRNRHCINPEHLEAKERRAHLRLHATSDTWWAGEKNSQAKLRAIDVQFIRAARPFLSARTLAQEFGIGIRNVYHIWSGEGWPHVGLPNLPPRPLSEVLQAGREAAQKALDVLLSLQQDRRERETPQPPNISEIITLAKFCAGQ